MTKTSNQTLQVEGPLSEYMKIARQAVKLSSEVIMSYYGTSIKAEWKEDATPFTIADQKAEEVIREFLMKEMPEAGLIGEEFGAEQMGPDYNWVIDPIDGTKSFMKSVPLFGTLLALYHKDTPILGIIDLPALNSTLSAETQRGAWVDGRRASVSSVNELKDSTILSGTVNTMEDLGLGEQFQKLRHEAWLYRGWGDCYGYYQVATGQAEIMIDPIVSVWDVAPLPVIMQEAGGQYSDLKGGQDILKELLVGESSLESDTKTAIAGNSEIYTQALGFFK